MPKREENIDFSEFNRAVDMDNLMKEYNESESGTGDFVDVPFGTYECEIASASIGKSKKGDPMLKVRMRVVAGEYRNQSIFYNQVLTTGYGIHNAMVFLRSLKRFEDDDVKFEGDYGKLNDLVLDVAEACNEDKLTFQLKYSETDKGYSNYKIEKLFEKN